MKSAWKVTSNWAGNRKIYAVYRLRDINAIDHSGNRELHGAYMDSREDALTIANELNETEELGLIGGTHDRNI